MFRFGANKELSDEEAMVRFNNGDALAFDLLLHRHSSGLLRFIIRMISGRKSEAEDLLQEVFVKVIENRKKYDPSKKFTSWLYTLARNHCIDHLRIENHRKHRSLESPTYGRERDGLVILDKVRSEEKNQEERAINEEMRALLSRGIEELRQEFKEVFLLREVQGLSLKEIEVITEVPLSTVKSRLRYAYRYLREHFIKAGYFDEVKTAKEV